MQAAVFCIFFLLCSASLFVQTLIASWTGQELLYLCALFNHAFSS